MPQPVDGGIETDLLELVSRRCIGLAAVFRRDDEQRRCASTAGDRRGKPRTPRHPISVSRVIALGRVVRVAGVESTKCPVSASAHRDLGRPRRSPNLTQPSRRPDRLRKDRAQRLREVEVDLVVDLQLVDAGQAVLDRVLDRDPR